MRIYVAIPQSGSGAPWGLSLEQFAEHLTAMWPDALTAIDLGNEYPQVHFEIPLAGRQAEGFYYIGPRQHVACWDATIEDWAPFIEWFLGLLPLESDVDTFLDAVPIPTELPRLAGAADIARILTDLDNSQ